MRKFIVWLCISCMVAGVLASGGLTYHAQAAEAEEVQEMAEQSVQTQETAVGADEVLQAILADREVMALVYLADEYPVREAADYDAAVVKTVPSGQLVEIRDVCRDAEEDVWVKVSFFYGQEEFIGYLPRVYLACSDERFLAWEEANGLNPAAGVMLYDAAGAQVYPDVEQFPESYKAALLELKKKHPSWTFVKMNTGLDWEKVIHAELQGGKSLVHSSLPDYTKAGPYDNGSWFYATKDILKYYMDPRNMLNEKEIFQFEQLTYNETYHTQEAVDSFLKNTFMNSSKPAPGMDEMVFSHIFWAIGASEECRVSPFHLAARVYQEQGKGTSPLISGNQPGYEGYYNYFNIGASGTSSAQVIENGLKYAKDHGWNNAYNSIRGGADVISANYIRKGQDTLYLQKYNVNPNGYYPLYSHQYMQNISAPSSEGKSIQKLYASADSLENTFAFKIPVFENMPEQASPYPTACTDVILQFPEGFQKPVIYLDGVAYQAETANGRFMVKAPDTKAKTATIYRYNENGAPVGMYLWTLRHENNQYLAEPQPELQDLLTYHGFSIRITGKSGIRFKTGISAELRKRLVNEGVNGYVLKEYGTLIMNNANRQSFPMIKDGEKVLSGMAYGINAEGRLEDKVFETVDGRYRFTSVLVGLPATQYKTEYAFRGYLVLEKNGQQITVYGPAVAKSIYSLAEQVLGMGSYEPGSEADCFLKQLITDGDAAAAAAETGTESAQQ